MRTHAYFVCNVYTSIHIRVVFRSFSMLICKEGHVSLTLCVFVCVLEKAVCCSMFRMNVCAYNLCVCDKDKRSILDMSYKRRVLNTPLRRYTVATDLCVLQLYESIELNDVLFLPFSISVPIQSSLCASQNARCVANISNV